MNRLERVGETLRAALNGLAVIAPEWLTAVAEPEWFKRYGSRVENFNLPKTEELATIIGLDGRKLLQAIENSIDCERLRALTEILILQRVWDEQFVDDDDGQPRFRELKEMPPPAALVSSPYDPEAVMPMPRDSLRTLRPRRPRPPTIIWSRWCIGRFAGAIYSPRCTWWTRDTPTPRCW
jgi:hypothetical protein